MPVGVDDENLRHLHQLGRGKSILDHIRIHRKEGESTRGRLDALVVEVETRIAEEMLANKEFSFMLTSQQLAGVFAALIAEVAIENLPLKPTLFVYPEYTFVEVKDELTVQSLLHIHSPLTAFIPLGYKLANSRFREGQLKLVENSLTYEVQAPELSFFQKQMLKQINIEKVTTQMLANPNKLVAKVLSKRLKQYGYNRGIGDALLYIVPDEGLRVNLRQ